MDSFMIVFDALIILAYSILVAFITPFTMGYLKRKNYDVFIQLLPVMTIIFLSSVAISMALGGFGEILFFKIASIVSVILLVSLLFLTVAMRILWKEKYDGLIEWILSLRTKNERSFSLK